jgi:hypothetical protein
MAAIATNVPDVLTKQSLIAQVCAGPPSWLLALVFFGPFALAFILLFAGLSLSYGKRRGAAVCLVLSMVFFVIGLAVSSGKLI